MEFDPGFHKEVAKTMEYRPLGKTDMMVSKISLGGASFGINGLFSYHENLLESIEYLNFWFHENHLVHLIEHPILQIPNILFVYSLSIFLN